jgi:uncharacterized protein YkuJ
MGDRAAAKDTPQNPGPGAASSEGNWLERSGFLERARSLRDTAGNAAQKTFEKGREVVTDVKNSEAVGQIVDQAKDAANSPTARRVTGEVVRQGKEIGREKTEQVRGVVDAGRQGDVQGVIRNGAPLVKDVLAGPELFAMNKAFDTLIATAPTPERRRQLESARRAFDRSSQIMDPDIIKLVEGQMKRQAAERAVEVATNPEARRQATEEAGEQAGRAGRFFRGIGERLHIVKPREEPEPAKRRQ